jgi:hypothetical protein
MESNKPDSSKVKPKVDKNKLQVSKDKKQKALTTNQIVTKDGKRDNTKGD